MRLSLLSLRLFELRSPRFAPSLPHDFTPQEELLRIIIKHPNIAPVAIRTLRRSQRLQFHSPQAWHISSIPGGPTVPACLCQGVMPMIGPPNNHSTVSYHRCPNVALHTSKQSMDSWSSVRHEFPADWRDLAADTL